MGACFALATYGASNVFDSAVFWFRGGKDIGGDGYMQKGDFFDDLHANEPTHDNHQMSMSTSYSSVRHQISTLPSGTSGILTVSLISFRSRSAKNKTTPAASATAQMHATIILLLVLPMTITPIFRTTSEPLPSFRLF